MRVQQSTVTSWPTPPGPGAAYIPPAGRVVTHRTDTVTVRSGESHTVSDTPVRARRPRRLSGDHWRNLASHEPRSREVP
eukprot:671004-Hanusia_phi.AAC.1